MPNPIHVNLTSGRWFELSLAEQLGNIGSEVGRAISWQKRGDETQKERALERALELFDLTIADRRWLARLKELARAREVLADYFYGGHSYKGSAESLEKYFNNFAYAARLAR